MWNALVKWNFLFKDEEMRIFSFIIHLNLSVRDHRHLQHPRCAGPDVYTVTSASWEKAEHQTQTLVLSEETEADLWFIHWTHCFWTSVFMGTYDAFWWKTGLCWIHTLTLGYRLNPLTGVIYGQLSDTSISTSFLTSLKGDKCLRFQVLPEQNEGKPPW